MKTKSALLLTIILSLSATITSCANTSFGNALENSVKPDPQLEDNPAFGVSQTTKKDKLETPEVFTQLPDDFPEEIPRYPEAELQTVSPGLNNSPTGTQTTWQTRDPINAVQNYYQKQLKSENWEIIESPSNDGEGEFIAEKDDLKVTISLNSEQNSSSQTEFKIGYIRPSTVAVNKSKSKVSISPVPLPPPPATLPPATVTPPNSTPKPTLNLSEEETPSDTETIPVQPDEEVEPTEEKQASKPPVNSEQAPAELRQFVTDIAQLNIFKSSETETSNDSLNNPNKVITRAEYARALVNANNTLYADRPAKQIRLGVSTNNSVFTDVPASHPDFAVIQGLARAGLIPSSLSGESTAVKFRPDAPLTREDLILWKVPLDTRQALPKATVDAVQERWGFQDAAKINTKALQAVLADFDNGDNANIRRVFGYTTLFQPKESVTRAEAAAALWYFGFQGDGVSAEEVQSGE
ncbi:MAG: S-layer homology domain-containing protein [Microcoleaceae cyanobacterium]